MGLFSKLFGGGSVETAPERAAAEPMRLTDAGVSWGSKMPAEENQYSFPGGYEEYFANVFYDAFPDYTFERDFPRENAVVFRFLRDGATALVVELMSERSSAQKLRRDCRAQGVPYLRFYHDHEGWWNTRSYVIARVRCALGE